MLEPAGDPRRLTPQTLELLMAACYRNPTYLDRYYSLHPGELLGIEAAGGVAAAGVARAGRRGLAPRRERVCDAAVAVPRWFARRTDFLIRPCFRDGLGNPSYKSQIRELEAGHGDVRRGDLPPARRRERQRRTSHAMSNSRPCWPSTYSNPHLR